MEPSVVLATVLVHQLASRSRSPGSWPVTC